uniref:DNA (cytosine-5-)-methyltransferase n=1 Tax=Bursaphelenchus xylophilus TaxID=6326 RepID=A0A1I7S1R8_BURXY
MVHKDAFVPLDEFPEVKKAKNKGIKGQLLDKFKNIQTRFSRDLPAEPVRAPLARPEESRECSVASYYCQIEDTTVRDDRKSPLAKLRKRLLARNDLDRKLIRMKSDEHQSRRPHNLRQMQSKSVDDDLEGSTDEYTEIPMDLSIQSSPPDVVSHRSNRPTAPRPRSLDKLPPVPNGKHRIMERKILSGSYQIRVVRRPHSLDLERREMTANSWQSQTSAVTEDFRDYRDGIFDDIYDEVYEEKSKPKATVEPMKTPKIPIEKPAVTKNERKLEDVLEDEEPEEQFVDVIMRKPEEKSIYRLNLRPTEKVDIEVGQENQKISLENAQTKSNNDATEDFENTENDLDSKIYNYECYSPTQTAFSGASTRTRTNSETSSMISNLPDPSIPDVDEDGVEWIHTCPIVTTRLIKQDLNKFYPRILPYGMLLRCDKGFVNMPITEYFVIWSNGYVAMGIIKDIEGYEGQPVSIQVGNFHCSKAGDLFVGCTVQVSRYSNVKINGKVRKLVHPEDFTFEDLSDQSGIPKPQAFAVKWSIKRENQPELLRHLGKIEEFRFAQRKNGRGFRLFGVVMDSENMQKHLVKDDNFPGYIKGGFFGFSKTALCGEKF